MTLIELGTLTTIIVLSPALVELVLGRFTRRQDRLEKLHLERLEKSLNQQSK